MNVVIVKRENCGQKCLFEIPDNYYVVTGDLVQVETKKGKELATCLCDSFELEEDNEQLKSIIFSAFGATKPLGKVIGKYIYQQYDEIE